MILKPIRGSALPGDRRRAGRRWSIAVVIAAWLVLGTAVDRGPLAGDGDAFKDFWKAFRVAMLHGDQKALSPMIAIPFIVEDSLDVQTRLNKVSTVLGLMPSLLDQDVGLSAEPESMRHYIERLGEATEAMLEPGGERARIGQFLFQRIGGRWMFAGAYLEP